MFETGSFSRRQFVQAATALAAVAPFAASAEERVAVTDADDGYLTGRLYKTLKIGMVGAGKTLIEKFNAAKEAGFDGIELSAPGLDVEEVRAAIAETGLPVDGTVCADHWGVRHTDPDPAVRAKALENLLGALRQTHAVGGNTVLLVVGRGSDGPEDEIWKRSIENISKALPLAAQLGCYIAIENVWNQFLYDHDGDHTQTAEKFVRYVDEFDSPWVGMQFDIGNHWKYGSMGDWIRALGRRVTKLDLKGFSRAQNKFTKIGEGDLDWADVRRALKEIRYTGWAAAEVGGGDLNRLKEISANMDKVFGLMPKA